jgi:hypothetical protein
MSQPTNASPHSGKHPPSFWLWVMCLTGVDYFSTLGYQPSIAVQSAGQLAPLATVVLVLVTLFGALPVYRYVASKSFDGQGSIGMLARLLGGWPGKILVLILLGFAATDFVITKTLSAADAAVHLIENPNWPGYIKPGAEPTDHADDPTQQIVVTVALLLLLGGTFLRGFKEVITIAVVIVGVFLALNVFVIGSGLVYLAGHQEFWNAWIHRLNIGEWHLPHNPLGGTGGWLMMLGVALLIFPKLALGLSGFETGVAVMNLVKGNPTDTPQNPAGRIAHTKKLLLVAAVIMSVLLLSSSVVVSTLIEPAQITPVKADGELPMDKYGNHLEKPEDWPKKPAAGRALAYLAHGESATARAVNPAFGSVFGTIYDISTIIILWFAGASAMAGLLNLVPQYLPKYGMAPEWARAIRPLVILFTMINLLVTWVFKANVDAQGGAYATGVLALMSSACVAATIDIFRNRKGPWYRRLSWPLVLITIVFFYTTTANEIEKHFQGLTIASFFIGFILITSLVSRIVRARELRFSGFKVADPQSKLLWDAIRHLDLTILVPHRPGRRSLAEKEQAIRKEHRIPRDLMVVFVEVELDDASDFTNEPVISVHEEEGRYVLKVSEAASISHTLAALALEMAKSGEPPEIHFGWTDASPLSGGLGFLLFGEGNVPWMVRELLKRAEKNPARRPLIIIAGA